MTVQERNRWLVYLNRLEQEENQKLDYYLAQIAYEVYSIRMLFGVKPKLLKDFLIKYQPKKEPTAAEKLQFRRDKINIEKAYWGAISGRVDRKRQMYLAKAKKLREEYEKKKEAQKKKGS